MARKKSTGMNENVVSQKEKKNPETRNKSIKKENKQKKTKLPIPSKAAGKKGLNLSDLPNKISTEPAKKPPSSSKTTKTMMKKNNPIKSKVPTSKTTGKKEPTASDLPKQMLTKGKKKPATYSKEIKKKSKPKKIKLPTFVKTTEIKRPNSSELLNQILIKTEKKPATQGKSIENEKKTSKIKLSTSGKTTKQMVTNLLDLPNEILINILRWLSCDEISKLRLVCHQFDSICANILFEQFKLLEVRLLRFLTEGRIILLQFDDNISDKELLHYDMLDKIDSILFKMLNHVEALRLTIGSYVEENNFVFFPGKIIDKMYSIMETLLEHMKNNSIYEEVPYYCENGDFDTFHLDKLVVMALNFFNYFVTTNAFNCRSSTVNRMENN